MKPIKPVCYKKKYQKLGKEQNTNMHCVFLTSLTKYTRKKII